MAFRIIFLCRTPERYYRFGVLVSFVMIFSGADRDADWSARVRDTFSIPEVECDLGIVTPSRLEGGFLADAVKSHVLTQLAPCLKLNLQTSHEFSSDAMFSVSFSELHALPRDDDSYQMMVTVSHSSREEMPPLVSRPALHAGEGMASIRITTSHGEVRAASGQYQESKTVESSTQSLPSLRLLLPNRARPNSGSTRLQRSRGGTLVEPPGIA